MVHIQHDKQCVVNEEHHNHEILVKKGYDMPNNGNYSALFRVHAIIQLLR